MKTVNLFFYSGKVWSNAVGDMARRLVARSHAPDFEIVFGERESDGDLVHYFDAGPAEKGNRPGLMGVHQISPRMPGRMLSDRAPALRRHLGAVVLTNTMADAVRAYSRRIYVVPGSVDERFVPATIGERADRIACEPFTVGLVGHQRHGKFDTKGREALENVIGLCPEYRYRIAGLGWGKFEADHQALGRDVRVKKRPHDDMADFYRGIDVQLCLSREEGGCLPILEALACGVPVVATRVGYAEALGLPEFALRVVDFIGDQFLADASQVASALRELSEKRESIAMRRADIAATVGGMTWQNCVERHEAMYREVLSDA